MQNLSRLRFIAVFLVAYSCACVCNSSKHQEHQDSWTVATVGSKTITRDMLEAALRREERDYVGRPRTSRTFVRSVLDQLIDEIIMANEARRLGLDKQSPISSLSETQLAQLFREKAYAETPLSSITEGETIRYYRTRQAEFRSPQDASKIMSFEQVRMKIRIDIWKQKREVRLQQTVTGLKLETPVTINDAVLDQIVEHAERKSSSR